MYLTMLCEYSAESRKAYFEIFRDSDFDLKFSKNFNVKDYVGHSGNFKGFNFQNFEVSFHFFVKSREVKLFRYVFRRLHSISGMFFLSSVEFCQKTASPNTI